MLLAYVDESYNDHYYWMGAVIVPEPNIQWLVAALDDAVASMVPAHIRLDRFAELHGYDMFHGKRDWAGVPPRVRIAVYSKAVAAIVASGTKTIVRGVDRKRLDARYATPYHPHKVVLGHLLERIDEYAENQNQFALVIADEVDGAAEYRRDLWTFQRWATAGYRSRQLSHIVDTIHFAPSHASRLVQAADLVAFLHQRVNSAEETDSRAAKANLTLRTTLQECVLSSTGCWWP